MIVFLAIVALLTFGRARLAFVRPRKSASETFFVVTSAGCCDCPFRLALGSEPDWVTAFTSGGEAVLTELFAIPEACFSVSASVRA